MTNPITQILAALALALAAVGAHAAEPIEKLWFTDSQVSAFYAIDAANHRVILISEPGSESAGHATKSVKQLADGEQLTIAHNGHGRNALSASLTVTRNGQDMAVRIATSARDEVVAKAD